MGGYGWAPAQVVRFFPDGASSGGHGYVTGPGYSVRYLDRKGQPKTSGLRNGVRDAERVRPRDPALRGKDKPRPLEPRQ
jgi:hypothetical protein